MKKLFIALFMLQFLFFLGIKDNGLAQTGGDPFPEGLVAHWTFTQEYLDSNGLEFVDRSGMGNNAIVRPGSEILDFSDPEREALRFNGYSNTGHIYLDISTNLSDPERFGRYGDNNQGALTFTALVKADDANDADIICRGCGPSFYYMSFGAGDSNRGGEPDNILQSMVKVLDPISSLCTKNNWPKSDPNMGLTTEWTHIAFILEEGKGFQYYINGKADNYVINPDICFCNLSYTQVGKCVAERDYFFNGLMGEIKLWNHVLNAEEIRIEAVSSGCWDPFLEIEKEDIQDPNDLTIRVRLDYVSSAIELLGIIESPNSDQETYNVSFDNLGNGVYELNNEDRGIFRFGSKYTVTLYAQDSNIQPPSPNISLSKRINILHYGPDSFEVDDTYGQAKIISIGQVQNHTIHNNEDQDWIVFFAYSRPKCPPLAFNIQLNGASLLKYSLFDPNLELIYQSQGGIINLSVPPEYSEPHKYYDDNFYYLKIEPALREDPFTYELSLTEKLFVCHPGAAPVLVVLGRILNANGEGVEDGLVVELRPFSGAIKRTITRSLIFSSGDPNTQNLDYSNGWYFFSSIDQAVNGSYELWIKEEVYPITYCSNKVLKKLFINKELRPYYVNRIRDVYLDPNTFYLDPNCSDTINIDEFEKTYKEWGDPNEYPPTGDPDGDGCNNLCEFTRGSDPNNPVIPQIEFSFLQGLNLFPFYEFLSEINDEIYCFTKFCEDFLNWEGIVWRYNKDTYEWESYICGSSGQNFRMENGMVYLIYKNNPYNISIYETKNIVTSLLNTGFNMKKMSFTLSDPNEFTSFDYLKEFAEVGIKGIQRYNTKRGIWESSCLIFGKPAGIEFSILPSEAYLIIQNKRD